MKPPDKTTPAPKPAAAMKISFMPSPQAQAELATIAQAEAERKVWEAEKIRQARITLAKKDSRWFCSYVLKVEGTDKAVKLSDYHQQWQKLFLEKDRIVLWAHPEAGKCQPYNARIRLASGEYVEIGSKVGTTVELLVQDPLTMTQRTALGQVTENGVKPIVTLKLRSGREHRSTAEHPVYLPGGWVQAAQVRVGEYLACARLEAEAQGDAGLSAGEAELLGYLTGDGCLTRPHRVLFSNIDAGVLSRVALIAQERGWSLKQETDNDYRLTAIQRNVGESPSAWCARLGLAGSSHTKRAPAALFASSNAVIAQYLGAYWSCDGSAHPGKQCLEYSSVNRPLLEDAQLLLLRFGIQSRIVQKRGQYKGKTHLSWRLLISGVEHIYKFREAIPVYGAKARRVNEWVPPTKFHAAYDIVPAVWSKFVKTPITNQDRVKCSGNLGPGLGNHRSVVQKYLQANPNEEIQRIASDAVFWDRVESVTVDAPEMTYALGVDDPAHCYLVSGILSHNTWQLIGYCLWRMGLNPNIRIAWASNTYGQAERPVKAIMQMLTASKELHEVFPKLAPSSRRGDAFGVHALTLERDEVSKDPTLSTCGAFGKILGARVDLLIIDDAIDFDNTRDQEQRDKFAEWVSTTLFSRLTETAQVIVVGNAWHKDDLLHRMAANSRFVSMKCPLIKPDGKSGWPEVWSPERIQKKKEELGNPLLFARLYLCEVRDDASSRFQRAWLDAALKRGAGRSFSEGLQTLPKGYKVYTGVDLGVKQHSGADRTVIFTICIHPDQSREVLDIQAGRWQAPEIVQRLYDTHHRYHAIIFVEDNGSQDFIRQWLTGSTAIPIKPFNTGKNKMSPEFGIESLATEFYAGKWVVPELGTPLQLRERDIWLSELYNYDSSKHTGDSLMACWIAREGARQGLIKPETAQRDWFSR